MIEGELFAPPRDDGRLLEEFRRATGPILSSASDLSGAIAAARNSGGSVGSQAGAFAGLVNAIASGAATGEPGPEAQLVGAALANAPGISSAIGEAEASSGDPRVAVPGVDTGGGTGWIGGNAGDIRGRGRSVEGAAGEAEDIERRALEKGGI